MREVAKVEQDALVWVTPDDLPAPVALASYHALVDAALAAA